MIIYVIKNADGQGSLKKTDSNWLEFGVENVILKHM